MTCTCTQAATPVPSLVRGTNRSQRSRCDGSVRAWHSHKYIMACSLRATAAALSQPATVQQLCYNLMTSYTRLLPQRNDLA